MQDQVEYKISYYCSDVSTGSRTFISAVRMYPDDKDYSEEISSEFTKKFADDPNFDTLTYSHEDSKREKNLKALVEKDKEEILNRLLEREKQNISNRMQAVRKVCEIGHRIRASVKINNRQPLSRAIIAINNEELRKDIILNDLKQEYSGIISDELNVDEVIFVEGNLTQYFDYDLKPNFRSLGPKKLGKQANNLKHTLANMSSLAKNELYHHLKNGGSKNLADINLTLEDLETTFVSKSGYASEADAIGAVILHTELTKALLDRGFVNEFKAAMQGLRKTVKLDLSDNIYLEIFAEDADIELLMKFSTSWKHDLQVSEVKFDKPELHRPSDAHKLSINDKTIFVHIFKEER
jgi:uncharacterized protein DUF5915